ncbi:MFS transporter [Catenulispora rubra]|uniref:MFS transporter n=1 Tax=Catenulispora rubra TaxID=280293 RepID=UPI0018921458|nr:MFS transporter [Catenulispora rubra]
MPKTQRSGRGLHRYALAVCMAGGFVVFLDVTIVNVALPTIKQHMHASGSLQQWMLSGYTLAFGLMLVPAGRVGDVLGRRRLFVAGLIGFVAASAVCALAPTMAVLVAARIAQGAAGGVLTPQISATIQQLFQGADRARAFGYFASVVSVSSAVGPVAGGALISGFGADLGWRAVFFVNVPIGAVLTPLALRWLPRRGPAPGRRSSLDLPGSLLIGTAVVLVLLPFIQSSWALWRWWLLAAAAAVIGGFVARERRVADPVLDLKLFRNGSYTIGVIAVTLYFAALTPFFFIYTFTLQLGHHYSAVEAGLALTPFALGAAATGPVAGRWAARYGRELVIAGLLLLGAGMLGGIWAVDATHGGGTGWATIAPFVIGGIGGIGGGMFLAPNQSLTLSAVPVSQAGSAGGLYQTGQRLGASTGVAAVVWQFYAGLTQGGSYEEAYRRGGLLIVAVIALALVLAIFDWRRARSRELSRTGVRGRIGTKAEKTPT